MRTLRQDGWQQGLRGQTTVDEVLRVTEARIEDQLPEFAYTAQDRIPGRHVTRRRSRPANQPRQRSRSPGAGGRCSPSRCGPADAAPCCNGSAETANQGPAGGDEPAAVGRSAAERRAAAAVAGRPGRTGHAAALAEVLTDVRDQVAEGTSLDEAMAQASRRSSAS